MKSEMFILITTGKLWHRNGGHHVRVKKYTKGI